MGFVGVDDCRSSETRKKRRKKEEATSGEKMCDSSKKEDAKSIAGEQCNDVTRG